MIETGAQIVLGSVILALTSIIVCGAIYAVICIIKAIRKELR